MEVELDDDANAAYVRLRTGRVAKTSESKIKSLDVLLDYDKAGNLIGLEFLNLKELVELFFVSWRHKIRDLDPKSKTVYTYSALQELRSQVAKLIALTQEMQELRETPPQARAPRPRST